VALHPEDIEKTAFYKGKMLWQFTFTLFELRNGPANFERLIGSVLRGLTYETCLVDLDDVILIGGMFQELLDNLQKVFQRVRETHL
jgi:hypothetical protein